MTDFAAEPAVYVPRTLEENYLDDWPPILTSRRDDLPAHVSPSQLKQFARCPEQFRRVRVLGEREPPSAAIVWGSADHSTMEHNFRSKIETGEDLPIGDVQYVFAEKLEERVNAEGGIYEVKWAKDNGDEGEREPTGADARKAFGSVKDRGVALVTAYRQEVAPVVWPTRVEHQFLVDVTGIPVPIAGTIDVEAKIADPREWPNPWEADVPPRIIERKTAGKTDMNGEWLVQSRTYQLVVPRWLDFHLSIKPRELKSGGYGAAKVIAGGERFSFPPAPQIMVATQIKRIMAGIAYCFHTYGPDQPWPDALAHPWACGYCGFRSNCPWWENAPWASIARG